MSEETPFDRERWEAQRAHDASNEFFHRTNAAAIESGNLALKTLILLNGGAILSLLTFIGSNSEKHKAISGALAWFALGVISAGFSVSAAYLTNYFTAASEAAKDRHLDRPFIKSNPKTERYLCYREIAHWGAIVSTAASLALFVVGVFCASHALTAEPPAPTSIIKMYIGPVRLELTR